MESSKEADIEENVELPKESPQEIEFVSISEQESVVESVFDSKDKEYDAFNLDVSLTLLDTETDEVDAEFLKALKEIEGKKSFPCPKCILHQKQEKSQMVPTQQITYLGFELNSITMTVTLTKERATKIKQKCATILAAKQHTILNLAHVIGHLVSSSPGVEHGPLYYRSSVHEKTISLANHHRNYDAQITLSADSVSDLHWWVNNVETATKQICHIEPCVFIQSDASTHGWGGVHDGIRTGGRWKPEEISSHINYLELLAILLTLKALCHDCKNKHIRVQWDNTTAVCFKKNMGGYKSNNCNVITKHIWEFVFTNKYG